MDIDYLERTINTKTASRIRNLLFEECYKKASLNAK